MKTQIIILQFLFGSILMMAQPGANFYPHHQGDVWQYRWVSTGQIARTRYLDSLRVDSLSRDTYLYFRPVGTGARERIDSSQNVFNLNFQESYPRYRLTADSGASWIAGYDIFNGDTVATYRMSVSRIYQSNVFGFPTIVKVFRLEMIQVGQPPFWLANDYLAEGFGFIREDMEPSDVQYLSGAIVDGVQYGIIVHTQENQSLPTDFRLFHNYPNPFNPATTIAYEVPRSSHVKLEIFNILGQHIETIVNRMHEAGSYQIQFYASRASSGVFFYRLTAGTAIITKRMLLVR